MTPPKTLNSYLVLQHEQLDPETYVIVVYREGSYDPFVTALWSIHSPREWLHGHYFSSIVSAAQDFASRCKGP